jgi:C4-dicarboxylate-specific signal transduction histidine kinase
MSQDPKPAGDNTPTPPDATPLHQALAQNEGVKDSLVAVADDLLLVSTVLKQELPDNVQSAEVAQALEKHEELETQVQECATELEAVNQALADEIGEREKLERALAATQAALADEQANKK